MVIVSIGIIYFFVQIIALVAIATQLTFDKIVAQFAKKSSWLRAKSTHNENIVQAK